MQALQMIELADVSGGFYFGQWGTQYQHARPNGGTDGSSSGSGSGAAAGGLPGWNIRPRPDSPAYQLFNPNDKDDDQAGLG